VKWVGVISLVSLCFLVLAKADFSKAFSAFEDLLVENPVTQIYLFNRLYDTVFEVLVFSLAVLGVSMHSSLLPSPPTIRVIADVSIRIFARFIAFFLMVSSLYLALEGYRSPGGGFSAGVAGGTAFALIGMVEEFDEFERKFTRWKAPIAEKFSAVLFLAVAAFSFFGVPLITPLNVVVYAKVAFGSWMIVYCFIKHRGLL